MERICISLSDRQREGLKSIAEQTGYSQSELVRRTLDYVLTSQGINQVIPALSGTISIRR